MEERNLASLGVFAHGHTFAQGPRWLDNSETRRGEILGHKPLMPEAQFLKPRGHAAPFRAPNSGHKAMCHATD